MQQITRGKRVWLIALGAIMGVAAVANLVVAPVLSVVLIGAYAAIAGAAVIQDNGIQVRRTLSPLAVPMTGTPAAREAVTRARRLSGTISPEAVVDIGLIANTRTASGQFRPAGIAQSVSLDDEAIQPFVKLTVPADRSHRTVLVRFEILDRSGKTQFSRETEQFVRDGENLIACDRQLLLSGNKQIDRPGGWELQVSVNGVLAADYTFTVAAHSDSQPASRPATEGELRSFARQSPGSASYGSTTSPVNTAAASPDDDDPPLSLDDLLHDQRGGRS